MSQVLQLLLLIAVEEPHMHKIYCQQVRQELAHHRQLKQKMKQAKDFANKMQLRFAQSTSPNAKRNGKKK